jgi:Tfp pilus assembly protein PilF
MSFYKLRWLPGSLEIARFEEAFPVEGAKIPTEPETYSLITGYQTAETPVTIEVTCTKTPEPEDKVQNGAGWKYRCLAQRTELLQFIGHEAPGLYSIDITEPKPGTFTWTPQKFETVPIVCGPQIVGVYVIYDIEATRYADGQVAETKMYSQPYRISWLFIGCPGDAEDSDSIDPLPDEAAAMAVVKQPPTPENISALARIRAGHARSLLELAKQKNDPDLLRLAAMYAESATELAPTEALYWFLLSQIFAVNEGNIMADQEASDAAEKALELSPNDNRMRLFAGQLMYRQEFYSAALDRFEPAVQSDAKLLQPQLLAMMTFCYLTDLQVERGENFFASFLEQQPEADSARLTLAILQLHSGKDDAAISEVRKVADSTT